MASSSPSWALPRSCLSTKFDGAIDAAVDEFWRDFQNSSWWKAQLCQESHLKPDAVSPVGAQGLAQIMPATYAEIIRTLRWDARITAFDPERAIRAGAYYQWRMRKGWGTEGRTIEDRNRLGNAAYNAGMGSILKAQRACKDARLWEAIAPCLSMITGRFSHETITYVDNITRYAAELMERR